MKRKGFTLIELVMVIVIIGILAAVAVPRFMSMRAQASKAACQSDVAAIRSALTSWYANYTLNDGCPTGTPTDCDAYGYPNSTQFDSDDTTFANDFFADQKLPPTGHISNDSITEWKTCYSGGGAVDMDKCCP